MPYSNPEDRREFERKRHRRRYADPAYREASRKAKRLRLDALKREALNAYGGSCCARCGNTNTDRLELDHVNGDGGDHRQRLMGDRGYGGYPFYYKLRALGWPNDPPLQVLCSSCNKQRIGAVV